MRVNKKDPIGSLMLDMLAQMSGFNPRRKSTTIYERLTPCYTCNFPVSQKHHLLEFSRFGENDHTISICANCHDLYHLLGPKGERAKLVVDVFLDRATKDQITSYLKLKKIHGTYSRLTKKLLPELSK